MTDDSTRASEPARRGDGSGRTNDGGATAFSRRSLMRTTAGAGAIAAGVGAFAGTGAAAEGNIDPEAFSRLQVDEEASEIVTEDGETFVMRGLTIPDPKRLHRTRHIRGKTPRQLLDLVTDNNRGWYPRVIRVPALPEDIGEHPMGHTGPEYEDGELESPDAVSDNRRKMRPPQPPAFDEDQLQTYLEEYYDPIVERCRERGVYCIVDFHRHWHEQPPGEEEPFYAENHLPYDSDYTNYWAYNTFEGENVSFGTDTPASWDWIDQTYIVEGAHGHDGWAGLESEEDIPGTPYAAEHWQVNEALRDEAIAFWTEAAERYGDMEHVLFEPYNEPTAPGIWGPVQGCGGFKQRPLWDTYVDEFAGPIIDTIRQRAPDTLLLVGVPGWCQSVQALHWRDFTGEYENVAVTWHNYAGHDVSQLKNWFNDTDYQGYEDVAAETGGELVDPYLPPQEELYAGETEDCWGWENYEAQGLQEAMEYHPIVVTEFGWTDDTNAPGLSSPLGPSRSTIEYGEPLIEGMEADDRIGWVAFNADVRWQPPLFEYPDLPETGEIDLENGNFYDTPFEELPVACEEPPCQWNLLGNPDSGRYLKQTLQEYADDAVPFETTETSTPVDETAACEEFGEMEACNVGDEWLYWDVTGDGEVTIADVSEFQSHMFDDAVQDNPKNFNYARSEEPSVSHADVIALFQEATGL